MTQRKEPSVVEVPSSITNLLSDPKEGQLLGLRVLEDLKQTEMNISD